MLQNILLLALGFILGSLITMLIESSLSVSCLNKLRRLEFENKQLKHKTDSLMDETYELSARCIEMKKALNANGITDFDDW